MIRRAACSALVATLVLAWAGSASAAVDDPVAAEALFGEARDLVDKGNWDEGCPKFEASLKLHASSSTLINIARCHAHFGRVASAWGAYKRASAIVGETSGATRQEALEEIAKAEASALEPRLPKLKIGIVGLAPPGVEVTRDGAVIDAAALGVALPADPGSHTVAFRAPGYRNEQRTVELQEGKEASIEIELHPEAKTVAPIAPPSPVVATPKTPGWAWAVGGAGLVVTGVAIFFLADDVAASSALRNNCFSDARGTGCKPGFDYQSDNSRKDRDKVLFPIAGVIGLGAIGVGVYGLAAKPGGVSIAPSASTTGASISASGRF
jgi:hypothetical protein